MRCETASISVEFDETSGALTSLVDQASGVEHLADKEGANLFRIIVPTGRWDSRYVDARTQTNCVIERTPTGVTLRYPRLVAIDGEDLPIGAQVSVELDEREPELRMRLLLTNNSRAPIIETWFPLIGGWAGYAGRGKDTLNSGTTMEKATDPYSNDLSGAWFSAWVTLWRIRQRWALRYPVPTALPWLDLSGGGRGVSLVNYMRQPELGGFAAENIRGYDRRMCLVFGWFSNPEILPGSSWESAEFGLAPHTSDWRATASRYRRWLETWWTPADAPSRLREALGIENVIFRSFDGQLIHPLSEIGRLAREAQRYGIYDFCIWDYWMLGLYGRLHPGDTSAYPDDEWTDLRQGIAEARAAGSSVSALVNHRLLAPTSEFMTAGAGEAALLRNRDGAPRQEVYGTTSHAAETLAAWRGPTAMVACQRSTDYIRWADRNMDRLLDAGFDAMFIDQAVEAAPCFSTSHGHRSPGDTHEAALAWQSAFRRRLRKEHPDGYVIGELCDPFVAQSSDVIWHWAWSHGRPDVIAYTLPGVLQSWVTDRNFGDAQNGFLRGFLLQLTTRGLETGIGQASDAFRNYIAALATLRKRTAHATTRARFQNEDDVSCDGANVRRFATANGGSTVVVANPRARRTTARITLESIPAAPHETVLYHLDGSVSRASAGRGDVLDLEVELPSRGVAVWETIPRGKETT